MQVTTITLQVPSVRTVGTSRSVLGTGRMATTVPTGQRRMSDTASSAQLGGAMRAYLAQDRACPPSRTAS
jgi:LDH2 family malate/lactate/ureidoglycolate dehydrogenase